MNYNQAASPEMTVPTSEKQMASTEFPLHSAQNIYTKTTPTVNLTESTVSPTPIIELRNTREVFTRMVNAADNLESWRQRSAA